MSILIAWAVIGIVFYVAILLERGRWTMTDTIQCVPALLMVVILWPAGLCVFAYRIRTAPEWMRRRGSAA